MGHKRSAAGRNVLHCVRGIRRRRSKRVAIFLGAGASSVFGYPLTRALLPTIMTAVHDRDFLPALHGDPPRQGSRNRRELHRVLMQLLPGENLRRQNLPLVTSLLSLLDYSLASKQFLLAASSMDDTRRARQLLERAILEVLAEDEEFGRSAGKYLNMFCGLLTELRARARNEPLVIVTSNYDMAAEELAFRCAGVPKDENGWWDAEATAERVNFGFRWSHPETTVPTQYAQPAAPSVSLLKLHGSTNWLRCPLCDSIYVNPWGSIWHQAYRTKRDYNNECHCSYTKLEAQIVSPSFVREFREPNLLNIWKEALDALRRADEWIIIGYSFPDEDLGIRALFTRAYGSRDDTPHITAVQYDRAAFNRYDAFFDSAALSYCEGGLVPFMEAWERTR